MPIEQESLNTRLCQELETTEDMVVPQNADGKKTIADEAEIFSFKFIRDSKDYGTVRVTIDGLHQLKVYYDPSIANSPKHYRDGSLSWEDLLTKLKDWAMSKQLSFELDDNLQNAERDMLTRKQKQQMNESYHAINKKTSYNDAIPTVKVRIQHSREMNEGEQRFRQIEKIFIENAQGERILAPTTKPGIAKVYGRHIAEGGLPNDQRWNRINEMVEEYNKMAGFVRATRNGQFNESAQNIVNEGVNHYNSLRETLSKMTGKRGYHSYFESWTPALTEDEEQVDLSEMFMSSTLDPRIESVMPILGKLSKNISESGTMAETIALEAWADGVANCNDEEIEEAGNKPLEPSRFGMGDDSTPRELKTKMSGASDEHVKAVAKQKISKLDSKIRAMQHKLAKTELRKRGVSEGDYKDPEEAEYDDEYQEMVKRVGQKAKQQEKAKQQPANEGLDADQKAAGQLGPTEKVKNNNIGKLVGEGQQDLEAIIRLIK
jgi:hypothetical protein